MDSNAVFGVIYGQILDMYKGRVQNLPESQLPAAVRESNPVLRYKPLYKIEGEKTIIQIGTNVIDIGSKLPYIGWTDFSSIFMQVIKKICANTQIISRVTRFGIRYLDFFEGDIKDKITMKLEMDKKYSPINEFIRSTIKNNDFYSVIQFYNSANYNDPVTGKNLLGSVIDVDTNREYATPYFLDNIENEIKEGHDSNKDLFVSTLEPAFLKSLNPQYYDD